MSTLALVRWDALDALPVRGRCLTVQHDAERVVLFLACGEGELQDGRLGGARSRTLCASFAELMARCDWGRAGERLWALHLGRPGFGRLLRQAVHGRFPAGVYPSKQAWRLATRHAQVTLLWEVAPGPDGPLPREVPSLVLREHALRDLNEALLRADDLTEHVRAERERGIGPHTRIPSEAPYPLDDPALVARLTCPGAI